MMDLAILRQLPGFSPRQAQETASEYSKKAATLELEAKELQANISELEHLSETSDKPADRTRYGTAAAFQKNFQLPSIQANISIARSAASDWQAKAVELRAFLKTNGVIP